MNTLARLIQTEARVIKTGENGAELLSCRKEGSPWTDGWINKVWSIHTVERDPA